MQPAGNAVDVVVTERGLDVLEIVMRELLGIVKLVAIHEVA